MADLLLISCSATKRNVFEEVPAISLYDGPAYRVLRSYLREHSWPHPMKVAVLSAEYGLIGSLAPIKMYNRRMTSARALELQDQVLKILKEWSSICKSLTVVCGKDYIEPYIESIRNIGFKSTFFAKGPIGAKLHYLSRFLQEKSLVKRHKSPEIEEIKSQLYFLPDWEDMIDPRYDFENDRFSVETKKERSEVHAAAYMQPEKVCDGILVSLAQQFRNKGLLKIPSRTDMSSLAPEPLRERFGLLPEQLLFGDCGAFSYVQELEPALTVEQAVSLYELHEFDLGASVDHIPAPFLDGEERERRVKVTRENAGIFIKTHRQLRCRFTPVGVIQGTSPDTYSSQVYDYVEMGYRHLGIGGLVFRSDSEIEEIVRRIVEAREKVAKPLWIHLFGIFRPRLQPLFRELGITSFDSASYFRKAWLRSDQNYLGFDGKWYAAIRVPVSSDPRNKKKLMAKGVAPAAAENLEQKALRALHLFGRCRLSLEETLEAVLAYDELVDRNEKKERDLAQAYRDTLEARPWLKCPCRVCRELGIDVVIFRGANRNKRRGIHNTWLLYRTITGLR